jgi:ribosomal protein S6--L-glutamate ligase
MNLGVLSKNREYFPTTQLLEEIAQREELFGVYLSTRFVSPLIETSKADALFAGQTITSLKGIIPRIGRTQTEIGLLILQQLELMEIQTTISAQALMIARDKFRCYQALKKIPGILLPNTILLSSPYMFQKLMTSFKFPVVIKIPNATRGVGTIQAPNKRVAQEIIEALFLRYDTHIMVQEYLRGSNQTQTSHCEDIRVLVVGDQILGAMRRIAPKGEWRTNYAQGAICKSYQLSQEEQDLVHRIIESIGIEVAGIDLFPTEKGPFVLEVNACPGWKAFEQANPDIRVAKSIIDYIVSKIHH